MSPCLFHSGKGLVCAMGGGGTPFWKWDWWKGNTSFPLCWLVIWMWNFNNRSLPCKKLNHDRTTRIAFGLLKTCNQEGLQFPNPHLKSSGTSDGLRLAAIVVLLVCALQSRFAVPLYPVHYLIKNQAGRNCHVSTCLNICVSFNMHTVCDE